MGLYIISRKGGETGQYELQEFKHKVKTLKKLATEVFEDVEDMANEGSIAARDNYRAPYPPEAYGAPYPADAYRHDYGERRRS